MRNDTPAPHEEIAALAIARQAAKDAFMAADAAYLDALRAYGGGKLLVEESVRGPTREPSVKNIRRLLRSDTDLIEVTPKIIQELGHYHLEPKTRNKINSILWRWSKPEVTNPPLTKRKENELGTYIVIRKNLE